MPRGPHGAAAGSVGRQRGKECGPEPSRWFLGVEETGKEGGTGLGLAGLSNFIRLWGTGTVFSCPIPGSAECCPPGFQASLITRNQSEARQETGARPHWSPCSSSRGNNKVPLLTGPLRRGELDPSMGRG